MVTTRPPKTIVKPTALGPVANTDTKFLIYGLFQKGRVLAQDGIESSPAFVREPEGNGCIERFFKTLKEQLLWVRHFRSIPELVHALQEFRALYNRSWLIERLGFQSPVQARERLALEPAA